LKALRKVKIQAELLNFTRSEEVVGSSETDVWNFVLAGSWVESEANINVVVRYAIEGTYKLYFMNSSTSMIAASFPHL